MNRGIDATAYVLISVLIVYAALGTLFAFKTPSWQNPDEPAHYNYIAHLATERQLPVLRMGDYDGAYLERLMAERFPPDLSIEPVRYESHQPPLYYLLAVPIYWLSQGLPLALRLFSVVLGGGVVAVDFPLCARGNTRVASHCTGGGRFCGLSSHARGADGVGQQRRPRRTVDRRNGAGAPALANG